MTTATRKSNLTRRWGILLFPVLLLLSPALSYGQDDDLVAAIEQLINDDDKEIRSLAFEQIRTEVKGAENTKKFAALLPGLKTDAQIGLLSALADRADSAARDAVVELLNQTEDAAVKVAAISALGGLGTLDDAGTLVGLLTDNEAERAKAAKASLVRIQGEGMNAKLAEVLKASEASAQVLLLDVLATRRALETIPTILELAEGKTADVRAAAMKTMGEIGGPEQIAGMVKGVLAAEKGRERANAEKAIMFVCHRIENVDERAKPLLAAMEGRTADERNILFSTLGRVGGAAARDVVEKALGDPQQHALGITALCNWPDASVAFRLLQLARIDGHEEHRAAALRAIIRIAPLPDDRTDANRLDLLRTAFVMCQSDRDRTLVLERARAIRDLATLEFVRPFMDSEKFREIACETVVELAHHRTLREPNKPIFDAALDHVIAVSKDEVLHDRANRYKNDQTWVRPK